MEEVSERQPEAAQLEQRVGRRLPDAARVSDQHGQLLTGD